VAAQQGWCRDYTRASFKAWFGGQALGADESLRTILESLGKDPQSIIERANSPEIRSGYDDETDVARQLRIFGSPTFVVDREIFWGDDRLEEAVAWAKEMHPAQASVL
jgi:2-hydroxychromene-2-carboxylate isomerase